MVQSCEFHATHFADITCIYLFTPYFRKRLNGNTSLPLVVNLGTLILAGLQEIHKTVGRYTQMSKAHLQQPAKHVQSVTCRDPSCTSQETYSSPNSSTSTNLAALLDVLQMLLHRCSSRAASATHRSV